MAVDGSGDFTDIQPAVNALPADGGAVYVKEGIYDESVETQYQPPVTIKGRAKIEKDRLVLPGGESLDVDGRVTFRTEELRAKGVQLDFGARIGVDGGSYLVIRIERTSEVGDEFLLTRVFLQKA
ncbi:MAG: pectinesterase family protein [bacterium]|nr:pectinesterase family protein [bacterium]